MICAQSEGSYEEWMHTVCDKVAFARNIEAKNGNAATADGNELQEVFRKAHDFWNAKNIPDAMRFSLAAQGGFRQVATAAAGGQLRCRLRADEGDNG